MRLTRAFCAISTCLLSAAAAAQTPGPDAADAGFDVGDGGLPTTDIADVSLESLLETKVSVASATGAEVGESEAPAIVTVLTRQEIHDMNARDLIDVLRFVPGFDFVSDVEMSVGLAVRGISTLEGKALVLIDGMMVNDLAYGNVLFGNRFAIENIERIEIIRGPGSTVYGGFAELAVINIVTHPDKVTNHVGGSLLYGAQTGTVGRVNAGLQGSAAIGDLNVWASLYAGRASRSTSDYLIDGTNTVNLANYSETRPLNINIGAEFKGLSAQFIYDWYHNDTPIPEDLTQPLHKEHKNLFASLKYAHDFGKYVAFQVFVRYQHQNPWQATDELAIVNQYYNDLPIDRILGGLSVTVKPIDWLHVLAGATFNYDTSSAPQSSDPRVQMLNYYTDQNGNMTSTLSFWNVAAYAEAFVRTPVVNVTLGARYDHNSQAGDSFVPRLALTKEIGRFHAKALFGMAFRPPTFFNVSYDATVKPETATVFEVEAGYQFTSWLYVGANVFDNRIRNVIVYQTDPVTGFSSYLNGGTSGTHGVEAEVKLRGQYGYVNLGYSFYAATVNGVDQFNVPGHPEVNLGVPAHKFTARGSLKLGKYVSFQPALIVYSERYALEQPGGGADFVVQHFPATALADAFLTIHDAYFEGVDVSVGAHDIFDSGYKFATFYNSGSNAIPGPGREAQIRITYNHDFVK
jgi:outer membrane receptor protein involved in Fe transport